MIQKFSKWEYSIYRLTLTDVSITTRSSIDAGKKNSPWLSKIHYSEGHWQKEAQPADSEVSNAKKVILSAKPGSGRENKLLLAIETIGVIIVLHCHLNEFIFPQIHFYLPIQLPKSRKSCSSHPINEVLLLTQLSPTNSKQFGISTNNETTIIEIMYGHQNDF